ncbi:hypothetical protein [Halocalculus aciditolerans]|uniref:Uncharacterized protein n=1 Tax=Halocalculus aciditolerans TaxID=1383812 RepID=A0A830FBA7_9EURY|nr:hypothetical protein [Halocalculus aciditolerans]GGL58039.1 hypothetical protein GCM10009039_15310 [Halocalculus aciditolerans]
MSDALRRNAADEWQAADAVTDPGALLDTATVSFGVARARYNHAAAEGASYE